MELPKLTRKAKERERVAIAQAEAPMTRLEERREELREKFAQLQWDLGGAAYEMAARDYFRLDVLARIAARLQTVDAELAEIERMARLEAAGASGSCPGCGSLYASGAVFCWRCGRDIHAPPGDVPASSATVSMPAGHNGHALDPAGQPTPPTTPDPIPGGPHPRDQDAGLQLSQSDLPGQAPGGGVAPTQAQEVDPGSHFDPGRPVQDVFIERDVDPPPEGGR